MKEVNEHVKEVMGITPSKKVKKDYTKAIIWTVIGAVTVTMWSLIYYLFSY
jgi:hypothetical protein